MIVLLLSSLVAAQQPPSDGRGVLERMHTAYAGRWYTSIAFVQKTALVRAGGQRDTAT